MYPQHQQSHTAYIPTYFNTYDTSTQDVPSCSAHDLCTQLERLDLLNPSQSSTAQVLRDLLGAPAHLPPELPAPEGLPPGLAVAAAPADLRQWAAERASAFGLVPESMQWCAERSHDEMVDATCFVVYLCALDALVLGFVALRDVWHLTLKRCPVHVVVRVYVDVCVTRALLQGRTNRRAEWPRGGQRCRTAVHRWWVPGDQQQQWGAGGRGAGPHCVCRRGAADRQHVETAQMKENVLLFYGDPLHIPSVIIQ